MLQNNQGLIVVGVNGGRVALEGEPEDSYRSSGGLTKPGDTSWHSQDLFIIHGLILRMKDG